MQHFAIGALALVLALVLPVNAHASQETSATAAPAANSMKIAIDPQTGKLRPVNAKEEAELAQAEAKLNQAATNSTKSKLKTQQGMSSSMRTARARPQTDNQSLDTAKLHANGAIQVRVPQNLDSQITARRGANGELIIEESNQNGPEVVNE